STYIVIGGSPYRVQSMAANMDWILRHNPGSKAVIWAHDYHVSRTAGAMGSYLAKNHEEGLPCDRAGFPRRTLQRNQQRFLYTQHSNALVCGHRRVCVALVRHTAFHSGFAERFSER